MRKQLGFSAALLLSACQVESNIAHEDAAIINGKVATTGQFPAVGALMLDFGQLFQTCTITLIAPNIALSAAHCVDPELNGFSDLTETARFMQVIFNQTNVNGGLQAGGQLIGVQKIIENGAFNINNLGAGNDVSIIVLKKNVVGIDPIPVSNTPAGNLIGLEFTSVGYGVSDAANQSGSGIQRFTDFELEDAQGELNFYGASNLVDINGDGTIDNQDTTGVCFGDSGGPDLIDINGVTKVFGIHSFVTDGATCLGGAGAQRTDTATANKFINDNVTLFASTEADIPPPEKGGCSVSPTSPDGVPSSAPVFLLFAFGAFVWRRRSSK
jgi:MYXO-CTERM domain-containing protein